MKKVWIIKLIILITIILLIFFIISVNTYKPFTLNYDPQNPDVENKCITYNEKCVCFGVLETIIMESYPPQYRCSGYELCKDIIELQCEN